MVIIIFSFNFHRTDLSVFNDTCRYVLYYFHNSLQFSSPFPDRILLHVIKRVRELLCHSYVLPYLERYF